MIYLNGKQLENLHIGEQEIQRVLLGEQLIWENNLVVDLGVGKTWNIRALYPNLYDELTDSNFFILTANNVSASTSVTVNYTGDTQYLNITGGFYKTYNPSTGILNCYLYNNNNSSSTRVVMVKNISKLTYVGFGTSFNVSAMFPDTYQNMTADNFLIATFQHWNSTGPSGIIVNASRSSVGTYSASNTESFGKSYNPSTGDLTVYLNDRGTADGGDEWDRNSRAYVYATKKTI